MLINLWVRDRRRGTVHQVGTDEHDSLELIGSDVVYRNLQNGCSTFFYDDPDGYEFVSPPDLDDYISITPEQLFINRKLIHKDLIKETIRKHGKKECKSSSKKNITRALYSE